MATWLVLSGRMAELLRPRLAAATAEEEEAGEEQGMSVAPASESYVLHVEVVNPMTGARSANPVLQEALLTELRAAIGPVGVNADSGPNKGYGSLGQITAVFTLHELAYRIGSRSSVSVPDRMEAIITVNTEVGSSTWDGRNTVSTAKAPPQKMRNPAAVRDEHIRAMVKDLVTRLVNRKEFEYFR